MSLVNQTCWVVGGVGPIGRGITRALLQAGATVIVNSREQSRLERISSELNHPDKLVLVHGSLLPGKAESTIHDFQNMPLNHVVAHGAVRYWTTKRAGCDETYSLNDSRRLLDMDTDEFAVSSSQLVRLHFSAVQNLLPKLEGNNNSNNNNNNNNSAGGVSSTFTFVTGDGSGHASGQRTAVGELNSHHIWGLSAALRKEMKHSPVMFREVRVGLPVNRSEEERTREPRERPLSEDIGDLCAGLISSGGTKMNGEIVHVDTQDSLEKYLIEFNAAKDKNIDLPHVWEFSGSL